MEGWKLILMKYINHVGECEGTTFISDKKPDTFTQEEWELLNEACSKSYNLE